MLDDVAAEDQIVTAEGVQDLERIAEIDAVVHSSPQRVAVGLEDLDSVNLTCPGMASHALGRSLEHFAAQCSPAPEPDPDVQQASRGRLGDDIEDVWDVVIIACASHSHPI